MDKKHTTSGWSRFLWPIIALLVFASCGGGGGGLDPDPNPNPNPMPTGQWEGTVATSSGVNPGFVGVPELPFDSLDHLPSSVSTLELTGSEYMQKFNAEVDGTNLVLAAPDGELGQDGPIAYGLYSFTGLSEVEPQFLNIECLPRVFGEEYYVLLADFTAGDWVWFGPVTFPEFELDMQDLNHRFVTELGNMYFIVMCGPGNGATLARSVLTVESSGGGGDDNRLPGTPHHLVATDGTYEDKVVIEWGTGDGAAGYELWRRLDGEDGEWGAYSETEGNRYEDFDVDPGVVYIYKARSFNDAGYSEFSNHDSGFASERDGDPIPAPHEIWASDGAHTTHVVVEWGYEGDYNYFELWRRPVDGGEFELLASIDGDHFRYEDHEAVPGVVYKYKVRAILHETEGPFSDIDTGFAGEDDEGPTAPFELWATDGEFEDKVRVRWIMEGEWGHFKVFRKLEAADGPFDMIAEVEAMEYNDFNVEPEHVYLYKVQNVLNNTESNFSNTDSGYAGGNNEFPAPFELQASKGTFFEKIEVWWDFEGDYDYFEVWRRTDGHEGDFALIGTTEAMEYINTELPGDFTFIYKARAIRGEHEGPFSNTDHGYLKDREVPNHPFDLVASDGNYEDKVRIEWSMEGEYDSFSLWRKRDGEAFEWTQWANTEVSEFNDFEIDPGVVYIYKVYAILGEEDSEPSNTDSGYAGSNHELCVIEAIALNLEREPLPGVAMVLYGGEVATVLETNEAGVARFAELPRGRYVVVPVDWSRAFTPRRTLVDLREGTTGREVVFEGQATEDNPYRLWGEVYKFHGEAGPDRFTPLAGILLNITKVGSEDSWQVETDEAGFWQISELPVGSYLITPASEHYEFNPTLHDAHIDGETPSERLDFRGFPL